MTEKTKNGKGSKVEEPVSGTLPMTEMTLDAFDSLFGDRKEVVQIASSEGWKFWAPSPGEVIVGFLLRASKGNTIKNNSDATFYEFETTRPCRVFTETMESTEIVPPGTIVSVLERAGLRHLEPYADDPQFCFEVAVRCGQKVEFEAKDGSKREVWRYDVKGVLTDRPKAVSQGSYLEKLHGAEPWARDREIPANASA